MFPVPSVTSSFPILVLKCVSEVFIVSELIYYLSCYLFNYDYDMRTTYTLVIMAYAFKF